MVESHKTTWLDAWRAGMPLPAALRFHARLAWRRWRDRAPDASPHRVAQMRCAACGDTWTGVLPEHAGTVHRISWECGRCAAMTAREVRA